MKNKPKDVPEIDKRDDRRPHGCDGCHKDTPTELFVGYRGNLLWICSKCREKMSAGIPKKHHSPKVYLQRSDYGGKVFKK